MMLHIRLSGTARAVAAVTQALEAMPLEDLCADWSLHEFEGKCEIRSPGRISVANTWAEAVRKHMLPAVSLAAIRVGPWGRRR